MHLEEYCRLREKWSRQLVSFSRGFEGINKIACLVFGRPNDDPVLEIGHLTKIIAGDVLPLRNNHARLRPFAVLSEFYLACHGVEGLRSDVIRNLRMIETFGSVDGSGQYLTGRIAIRSEVVSKRIYALPLRPLAIL